METVRAIRAQINGKPKGAGVVWEASHSSWKETEPRDGDKGTPSRQGKEQSQSHTRRSVPKEMVSMWKNRNYLKINLSWLG